MRGSVPLVNPVRSPSTPTTGGPTYWSPHLSGSVPPTVASKTDRAVLPASVQALIFPIAPHSFPCLPLSLCPSIYLQVIEKRIGAITAERVAVEVERLARDSPGTPTAWAGVATLTRALSPQRPESCTARTYADPDRRPQVP